MELQYDISRESATRLKITRGTYPRFTAYADYTGDGWELLDPEFLDEVPADAIFLAQVMRETGDYIAENAWIADIEP